jgi:hypothetical protein
VPGDFSLGRTRTPSCRCGSSLATPFRAVTQEELVAVFQGLRDGASKEHDDRILEILDFITGWCHPRQRGSRRSGFVDKHCFVCALRSGGGSLTLVSIAASGRGSGYPLADRAP